MDSAQHLPMRTYPNIGIDNFFVAFNIGTYHWSIYYSTAANTFTHHVQQPNPEAQKRRGDLQAHHLLETKEMTSVSYQNT